MRRRSAAQRAQEQRTPVGIPHAAPAPVGGLNFRDALAAMPETDATVLDNMSCQPTWIEFRGGSLTIAKFTGYAETLMAYNGLSSETSALYAACTNGTVRSIYRVDNVAGGNVGSPVVGGGSNTVQQITNSNYDYNQFGSSAAEVLILLNGVDPPLIFDGSSWTYIASTGTTYTWTGGPTLSSLRYSAVYKQRLWFIQAGTMNVYYLPQTDFAGALTLLNMGANFNLGGYLVGMITVSIDNSAGTNDYIAFVSNMGEIVMFQGYDPSSVSTWSEAAHFRVGLPIGTGRNMWQKVGMDAMLLTTDGLILLSEAMLTDRAQGERNTVTDKIRYQINQAIQSYATNPGWQILLYPLGKKLLLNVPTTASRLSSYQFVQSEISGAWSTWGLLATPLNAFCWENWNNALYEGTTGAIKQADMPALISDDGNPLTIAIRPAYNYMGEPTKQKIFKQVLVQISTNGNLSLALSTSVDFSQTAPTAAVPLSQNTASKWGSAVWNVAPWGDAQQVVKKWLGMQGEGYCAAPYIQASIGGIIGQLQSLTYIYEPGSVFYG